MSDKIIDKILSKRKDNQLYVEPFVNLCNTIQHIPNPRIGNDYNNYKIKFWKSLLDGWIPPNNISYDQFYSIKNNKYYYDIPIIIYSQYYFSNSNTFRYNKNSNGKIIKNNLLNQVKNLKGTEFQCNHFENLIIPNNSLIFCNVPRYELFELKKFLDWCNNLKNDNEILILNNHDFYQL